MPLWGKRLKINWKFKIDNQYGKGWWVSEVLSKIQIEKMSFQVEKNEKYVMSKNDFKRTLGSFMKELWAIYVFFKYSLSLKQWKPNKN